MHPSENLNWESALKELACAGYDGPMPIGPTWLGDSDELSLELNQLVVAGAKQATSSLLWEWEHENEMLPDLPLVELLLNWDNSVAAVIETISMESVPFNQVTAEFAYLEGEGDRSLGYWRDVHAAFFESVCTRIGKTRGCDMPIVCERFIVHHVQKSA